MSSYQAMESCFFKPAHKPVAATAIKGNVRMESATSKVKPKKSGSKLFVATVILAAGVGGYAYWRYAQ